MMLSDDELKKYSRNLLIDGWDETVQNRLRETTVFIAGAGGLGSPVSLYLAAAGIGRLIICDSDTIEPSNLNRQILYDNKSVNSGKAECAALRIRQLNPDTEVIPCSDNVEDTEGLITQSDLIMDCLDNFDSRLFLNRVSFEKKIPMVHAGVSEFYGQITFIIPGITPCLNCFIKPDTPQSPKGITGAMAGIVGSIQALEAIKFLTGTGEILAGKLLYIDCKSIKFNTINIAKNPQCMTCSDHK